MRALCVLLIFASISGTAIAQTIASVDVLEAGIFTDVKQEVQDAPGTAAGHITFATNFRLLQATTIIPGRLGVKFGIAYRVNGRGKTSNKLKIVWLIPQPGIHNPNTGNTTVRSESFWDRQPGSTYHNVYSFDNAWEIVPGNWTIELWDGDRKLTSQSFSVQTP